MGNTEVIAGLIAGPVTVLITGIIKALFADSWDTSAWKKTIVFLVVLVVCAVTTAVVAALSGNLRDAHDLAGIYVVALATSQIVFRAVHAKSN